jgi:hypothetical protein
MHLRLVIGAWVTVLLLIVSPTTSTLGQADDPPSLAQLEWLAGAWHGSDATSETEEHWTAPKGRLMIGMNRTFRKPDKSAFEYMRIVQSDSGLVFIAQPSGASPSEFPAIEVKPKSIVFENKEHDFPQRILYKLDDQGRLFARIEGVINGKSQSMEWLWSKGK